MQFVHKHYFQRRTTRILKFVDKLSTFPDEFHFNDSFFNDLASSEFDPESPPPPLKPTEKRPLPKRKERPVKTNFSRNAAKEQAIQAKFADCELAGRISGYTYVKLYTDPYYRFLPPLSAASKKFDIRLAKLPHKELRDEKLWAAFLKSLERKPTPPPVKAKPKATDFGLLAFERNEQLRRRLPIISVLPKWLQQVKFNSSCNFEVTPKQNVTRSKPPSRGNMSGTGGLKPPSFSPEEPGKRRSRSKLKRKSAAADVSQHRVSSSNG